MVRPDKVEKVKELEEILSKAQSVYLADFTGMSVEMANNIRKKFRAQNIGYKIIKNTLAKQALLDMPFKDIAEHFQGPTAIAYSFDDVVAPSKIIIDFERENEVPRLKASIVEGKIFNLDQTRELAKIPPKEVLLSRVVGGIKSPIIGLVNTLNGVVRNLVYVLNSISEEKSKKNK